ncbi:MAG TPA: hypothetical protein DD397_06855 [Hyphomonas sp.]|jgi:hypothetical protein|uniref:hypothetical protein n=1 Tax=Hyphomonas sp. TaxID=87 RepID=UPI000E96E6C8|nr:hypothetical protein [Hyphomonas sp.]QDP49063.1 MAG: hypothetical protein Unbinned4811contig1001_8 [Prokaryotic dsDNA virus sp.]HBN92265.1 hypothetical protein [Hyphomonas sp.]|tara:strand:+ start:4271 stop:4516 length:246 start_codon:yes stop_codon:yes gene_type:complete
MDRDYRLVESASFGPIQYGVQLGNDGGFMLHGGIPDREKHARLLSAAPKLLAALHNMLEDGDKTDREQALQAIRDAEGSSS